MKKLEKLCLKGISEILSEKELKNVLGGGSCDDPNTNYCQGYPSCETSQDCTNRSTFCTHYGGISGSCCR